MQASIERVKACLKIHTPRMCVAEHFHDSSELVQGMYSVFLPDWLNYFNQEEMLVSSSPEISSMLLHSLTD